MKQKLIALLTVSALSLTALAEYVLYVNVGETNVRSEKCEDIDSIKTNGTTVSVFKASKNYTYDKGEVSLTFEEIVSATDTVKITYGAEVSVINPYPETVNITLDGNYVSVKCVSQLKDVVYLLSGSSEDGGFEIDCPRKFTVVMNNLTLKSQREKSTFRSFSGSTMTIELRDGTSSYLEDCAADTCNATLRSKGQIEFKNGNGNLEVVANAKRAIQTGDYLLIENGNIKASSTLSDVVRASDYFVMKGGTLSVEGTGIEVEEGYMQIDGGEIVVVSTTDDTKAIKVGIDSTLAISSTNGAFNMSGGTINLTVNGKASKGIKTVGNINIKGGKINGTVGGTVIDSGDDISYAALLKSDKYIDISGADITVSLKEEALGSRAIAADSGITVRDGAYIYVDGACEPFETSEGKKKKGYGFKIDGSVNFDECIVESSGTRLISINSESSFYVNEGAMVYLQSDKQPTSESRAVVNGGLLIESSEEINGSILYYGGYYVGVCDVLTTNMRAFYVSTKNVSCAVADATFTSGSSVQVSDANGVALQYANQETEGTTKRLQLIFPMTSGASYTYSKGGTYAMADNFHGFYQPGTATYTGGTDYTYTAANAGRIVSVTK